ncbi:MULTISPECIES: oligoendopeptidase F [unclassified Romboutsia]|uniref:oligoendopeptidase F n=1 Tax=unclassified Romboutsia TaxID=2626894 RepID=UPI0008233279|nr:MULTISPECIES: oligoendopeptidase F [unclassified Romboutsia]SCI37700.1 Oligoendopeptidase F%2C plasmid [uncultured Clostridium sp.]
MGIKFTKIILMSLLMIFSSVFITSEAAQSQEDNYLTVMYTKDEKDNESESDKTKIDYTKVTWNLESLFKNDEQWKSELKSFRKDIKELKNYIGKVTKSETHLAFALDIKEKLDIRLNKLCAYPKLKQDTNKNSYKYLDMNEEVNKAYKEYSSICSDLELEILKLSDKDYDKFMRNNKINKKYGMYINDIRRNKDHYLEDKEENLLNNASALASLPGNAYELFKNMDKKTNLTPGQYATEIGSINREERKSAYKSEFIPYNDNVNTLSALLIGQVKKNIFYSSARGYKSSLDMYLKSDDIDTKVYDSLIDTVSKNTKSLHKYIDLRKKVLNLDKVYYYDMFVPIVEPVDGNITYDKAQTMVYSAMSPLGEEYADIVYKAFNERWVDVYSNDNKVSGGYCLSVYDNHPYVLLNYNNSLGAVSTLSHELGHAIYEYLSSKNQNYFNSSPSIFTHEVASTTNEALLYEGLIKGARDDKEKAYYISEYLDLIKNTLYTQTMYAEFEKTIHEMVEDNKSVNALVLNDIWGQLLKKYYGNSYEVDPLSMVGWSRIPHFYNSFYVYKYATGCCAGVTFAQSILNENGAENYMYFLKRGSSDYPINILKDSGVNLTSTKPIQSTIKRFDDLVGELEDILAKQ